MSIRLAHPACILPSSLYKFDSVMSDWTPLHVACWENNAAEVRRLVDAKVNVDMPLNDGLTPLHIAAHGGISYRR